MLEKLRPILSSYDKWPISIAKRNNEKFIQDVILSTTGYILHKYPAELDLYNILVKIKDLELAACKRVGATTSNSRGKLGFWTKIESNLAKYNSSKQLRGVLVDVLSHYIDGIHGSFSIVHYNLSKHCITYTLSRLLNPISMPALERIVYANRHLLDRIHIEGDVQKIRSLASVGTIIMLPTHFSNLDSAVISWVIDTIGLPAFVYGAGVNLFNKKFWNYTLSRVGTYKIDRGKKNPLYLIALEQYSSMAIKWGCHSLFYPHGTRSRDGGVDAKLKTGLLSAVLGAQEQIYSKDGEKGRKLFLVPVSFSYPFVLEAPIFSHNCLGNTTLGADENHKSSSILYQKIKNAKNLLAKGSYVHVRLGDPFDVMGNAVDGTGNSFNTSREPIELCASIADDRNRYYRSDRHVKFICKKIIDSYYKHTTILCPHLVAYAAYFLIKRNGLDQVFLTAAPINLPYTSLKDVFLRLRNAVFYLEKESRVFMEDLLRKNNIFLLIDEGIKNLGVYHSKKPLVFTASGDITSSDLGALIYYSNRLKIYEQDFEKFLQ